MKIKTINRVKIFIARIKQAIEHFRIEYTKTGKMYYRPEKVKEIYRKELKEQICKISGIDWDETFRNRRNRKLKYMEPRQIHIVLLRYAIGMSLSQSAGVYNKDHSTVNNCKKRVNNLLETDKQYREKYEDLFRWAYEITPEIKEHIFLDWM